MMSSGNEETVGTRGSLTGDDCCFSRSIVGSSSVGVTEDDGGVGCRGDNTGGCVSCKVCNVVHVRICCTF